MTRSEMRLAAVLLVAMAMHTMAFFAVIVVASTIQNELDISKLQIGLLGAANTGIGGLFAVQAGKLCDALGGRKSVALVLAVSGATAAFMALSSGYIMLLIGMALGGFAQALGNPATNKAISTGVPAARRGLLTGVKQSGVQLSVFATGFAMPGIASQFGWRTGLWLTAALSFAGLLGIGAIHELNSSDDLADSAQDSTDSTPSRLSPFVYQVGVYGFLLGSVGGGIGRFLPLYAEEAVGFTPVTAGIVFGLGGLVAIPTRIASGVLFDRGLSPRLALIGMAVGAAIAMLLTWWADPGPNVMLWVGTVLGGLTLGSWNAGANLAMIRQGRNAGQASGVLILGFMFGLTVSGPVVGWSIDFFEGYTPALISSAAIALAGAAVLFFGSPETTAPEARA